MTARRYCSAATSPDPLASCTCPRRSIARGSSGYSNSSWRAVASASSYCPASISSSTRSASPSTSSNAPDSCKAARARSSTAALVGPSSPSAASRSLSALTRSARSSDSTRSRQHRLNFLPLPHGHGLLRPTLAIAPVLLPDLQPGCTGRRLVQVPPLLRERRQRHFKHGLAVVGSPSRTRGRTACAIPSPFTSCVRAHRSRRLAIYSVIARAKPRASTCACMLTISETWRSRSRRRFAREPGLVLAGGPQIAAYLALRRRSADASSARGTSSSDLDRFLVRRRADALTRDAFVAWCRTFCMSRRRCGGRGCASSAIFAFTFGAATRLASSRIRAGSPLRTLPEPRTSSAESRSSSSCESRQSYRRDRRLSCARRCSASQSFSSTRLAFVAARWSVS